MVPSAPDAPVTTSTSSSWGRQATLALEWGRAPTQHYQGSPCGICPVYQEMAQQYQYQPPNSGPHRNRQQRAPEDDGGATSIPSYTCIIRNNHKRLSHWHPSDHAFNETRAGGAWRRPSENWSMVSHDATRDLLRVKPYKKGRAARAWRKERTDRDFIDRAIDRAIRLTPQSTKSLSQHQEVSWFKSFINLFIKNYVQCDERWSKHSFTNIGARSAQEEHHKHREARTYG